MEGPLLAARAAMFVALQVHSSVVSCWLRSLCMGSWQLQLIVVFVGCQGSTSRNSAQSCSPSLFSSKYLGKASTPCPHQAQSTELMMPLFCQQRSGLYRISCEERSYM